MNFATCRSTAPAVTRAAECGGMKLMPSIESAPVCLLHHRRVVRNHQQPMILVRIDAEFVLVLATQTLNSRKPRTGVRTRGYAEAIIWRPATLGRAAARTVWVLAAVHHLCESISNELPCRDPVDRRRGRVRGSYNRRYATSGLPVNRPRYAAGDDDFSLARVAPH